MPNTKDYEKGYKKYESKAKEYMDDKEKAVNLLNSAKKKANEKKRKLGEVWEKLQLLFEIFNAWKKGEYKEIPTGSIIMIIATIIYFVSPIDFIPDFIVGLGLIDDAAVIGFTIKQISRDLEKYKYWKLTNDY
ncbi:YkvA family protein [Neobacillus sp. WH10]|uniref:YkvA family protein n=1 Tax=Neobacillus sp. WH10 TaxID=3047873 RepID=UPI0024C1E9BE|nr:YkvA family protein [Neobacillus sp. WH10]WHY75433.1 YkvA family protein [Neobacillus sp. WH10]